MIWLIDTNVLLRSVQKSHPAHADAVKAVEILLRRGDRLCVIAQNMIEFWAVATRPPTSNGLGLSIDDAAQEVRDIKLLFELLPDTRDIFPEWEALVVKHRVAGKQAHDARLVAAMLAHGVSHLLTFNAGDFARFGSVVTVAEPQTIK